MRVLWLDDQIEFYDDVISVMERRGMDVVSAANVESAIKEAANDFDFFLIDLKLSKNIDFEGIQFLHWLAEEKKEYNAAIVSAHLYQSKFRQKVEELQLPIEIIEKNFDLSDSELEEFFCKPIEESLTKKKKRTPKQFYKEMKKVLDLTEPLRISRERFSRLPEREREALSSIVRKKNANKIQNFFDDGYVYVAFSGSVKNPIFSARTFSEVPSSDELRNIRQQSRYAVFDYFAPMLVEEIGWSASCSSERHKDYPTVSYKFDDEGAVFTTHFDTGSEVSFMSYEFYKDNGAISPSGELRKIPVNGVEYKGVVEDLDLYFVDQVDTDGGSSGATVKVFIIKNWATDFRYARKCPTDCVSPKKLDVDGRMLCGHRTGLIGRNIFAGGALSVLLNGRTKRSQLFPE